MLELKNVCYSVETEEGKKDILKGVDLKIDENRFVVITGPNGGGKSTLAKIIAGVIHPTSGKIFLDGKDITDLSLTDRAKMGISFAFQQPVRFKGITVLDLLCLAAGRGLKTEEACSYLAEVGLCAKDYVNREVNSSLSGGELKRIEIATVLARKTRLTIFDEPEAGIDLWSFTSLIKAFEKMRGEIKDSSIIIISHQERILKIADEIVVLKNGSIARHGAAKEVLWDIIGTEAAQGSCSALKSAAAV